MNRLDREARAARYLDAMAGLEGMIARIPPSESIQPEPLCQLLGILNDEARAVVPSHIPGDRLSGLACDND